MRSNSLFIPKNLKKELLELTISSYTEICGVLIGYKANKSNFYLTDIIKDDNSFYSTYNSVTRNTESLYPLINEIVKSKHKEVDFIGDWHSHPKSSCNYSNIDYISMLQMLKDPDYFFLSEIILLITNQSKEMKAYLFTYLKINPIEMEIEIT